MHAHARRWKGAVSYFRVTGVFEMTDAPQNRVWGIHGIYLNIWRLPHNLQHSTSMIEGNLTLAHTTSNTPLHDKGWPLATHNKQPPTLQSSNPNTQLPTLWNTALPQ